MKSFEALQADLRSGTTSCERITSGYLEAIERRRNLNAFLAVDSEGAIEAARRIDRKLHEGTAGPLAGMVVSIKDILTDTGKRVTCGSRMLEHFVAPYDATAVRKLKEADAVLIGRTNMDEFAMGSSTENSAFGRVLHPEDENRVPGGSSGGAAVSVAAGLATAALGTDTGGSIRQPASFCGVVGLKPTYGRVSRYGLVAFASSFDVIGPISVTVRDAARILGVIAGFDPRDSTSANIPVPDYAAAIRTEVRGLTVGLPEEYFGEALDPEIRRAVDRAVDVFRRNGAAVKTISLPHTDYTISAYYILATAEASSNLARYDGARYGHRSAEARTLDEMYTLSRSEGFGTEVKRRIMLGTYVLSSGYYEAYYGKGQRVRRLIRDDFVKAFADVDFLVTPTSPTTAFRAGEKTADPLQMYLSDIYTTSANLAGIPGISIPCGTDHQGLPIGVQLLGRHFDEQTILNAASVLEAEMHQVS